MALSEFALIARYFQRRALAAGEVDLGIGDDAALLSVPPGQQLAVSADTLVEGVHFLPDIAPCDLGYRALAVNLSDMAAMGAEPRWYTLCVTLPAAEEAWLEGFCCGLAQAQAQAQASGAQGLSLVGGDTTRGPLSITVQIMGLVPRGLALTRSGARPGDRVCVTGTLGDAAAGLAIARGAAAVEGSREFLLERFHRPRARVAAGLALRELATACIDVSDGLLADLGHLCRASGLGARIDPEGLPLSPALREFAGDEATGFALTGGDDYELCFTLPAGQLGACTDALARVGVGFSELGELGAGSGVACPGVNGDRLGEKKVGYEHF